MSLLSKFIGPLPIEDIEKTDRKSLGFDYVAIQEFDGFLGILNVLMVVEVQFHVSVATRMGDAEIESRPVKLDSTADHSCDHRCLGFLEHRAVSDLQGSGEWRT